MWNLSLFLLWRVGEKEKKKKRECSRPRRSPLSPAVLLFNTTPFIRIILGLSLAVASLASYVAFLSRPKTSKQGNREREPLALACSPPEEKGRKICNNPSSPSLYLYIYPHMIFEFLCISSSSSSSSSRYEIYGISKEIFYICD